MNGDAPMGPLHLDTGDLRQGPLDGVDQGPLETPAVATLEEKLTEAAEHQRAHERLPWRRPPPMTTDRTSSTASASACAAGASSSSRVRRDSEKRNTAS